MKEMKVEDASSSMVDEIGKWWGGKVGLKKRKKKPWLKLSYSCRGEVKQVVNGAIIFLFFVSVEKRFKLMGVLGFWKVESFQKLNKIWLLLKQIKLHLKQH